MTKTSFKEPTEAPRKDSADDVPAIPPWFGMLGQWNAEIASLYGRRFQEWSTVPLRLLNCWSLDDLLDESQQFSRRLEGDYRATAAKLAQSFDGSASGAKANAEDRYAATLLKAQEDAARILDQAKAQARQILDNATRGTAPDAGTDSAKAA